MLLNKYYKDIADLFLSNVKSNKQEYNIMNGNMEKLPAYGHDIGNYVARYGMGNYQIQTIMKLNGRLDYNRLKKAVRLSIEAEPVLGCQFVEHYPPYWKRMEDIDITRFCSYEETSNANEAINRFLESHFDMDCDPMVKVKLIRTDSIDIIGIKLNHTCTDGGGVKEYIRLLSRIYSKIKDKNANYYVKPSVRSRRDHEKALKTLGIKYPLADTSIAESPRTAWPFPWKSGGHRDKSSFVVCKLPYGLLNRLSSYGKERGATINDLILTAFYRALFKLTNPPYWIPMDMGVTVDLRRYLPGGKAEAIRNFSGGVVLRIPRLFGESFEDTLSRISKDMNRKKKRKPGYQNATGAERMEKLNFYLSAAYFKNISAAAGIFSNSCFYCMPGLSNLGLISLIKFGDVEVSDAYVVPPVIRAPGLLLLASSYNNILYFSVGYYKSSIKRGYIKLLLNTIRDELIKAC